MLKGKDPAKLECWQIKLAELFWNVFVNLLEGLLLTFWMWLNKIPWLEWSPVWILQVFHVQKGFTYVRLRGLMERVTHLISTQMYQEFLIGFSIFLALMTKKFSCIGRICQSLYKIIHATSRSWQLKNYQRKASEIQACSAKLPKSACHFF